MVISKLAMVELALLVLPLDDEIKIVLQAAAGVPKRAGELVAAISQDWQAYVFRGLAWMVKVGVLSAVR